MAKTNLIYKNNNITVKIGDPVLIDAITPANVFFIGTEAIAVRISDTNALQTVAPARIGTKYQGRVKVEK